jgi:hypothetical protein
MSRLKQSFSFLGKVGQTVFIGLGGTLVIGSLGLVIVGPILMSETCQVYYLKKNLSEFVPTPKSIEAGKKVVKRYSTSCQFLFDKNQFYYHIVSVLHQSSKRSGFIGFRNSHESYSRKVVDVSCQS